MAGFTKAVRSKSKVRIVLPGPSGSGKTITSLLMAPAFGDRIAVVDTENGSASMYAGEEGIPNFDVMELDNFHYMNYIKAIHTAENDGYDILIIDSLTHAWTGKDGILEQVNIATARGKSGNRYTDGWGKATPMHNELIDAIIRSKIHIICTMRSIMRYVIEEDEKGKQKPKKVGMGAVQRKDLEYEFSLVGEMDQEHRLIVTKSRILPVSDMVVFKPGREFGDIIAAYLASGAELVPVQEKEQVVPSESQTQEVQEAENASEQKEINRQELLLSIQDVLTAKAGTGPLSRNLKANLCFKSFGGNVQSWEDITRLKDSELIAGLNKLKGN